MGGLVEDVEVQSAYTVREQSFAETGEYFQAEVESSALDPHHGRDRP